ncbi:hypothetical protein [Actinomycetospora lemnae]|uniref:Uncharacterized protein n=1 Tax=Actinomycetospora lemnae TaxID=3019891 RepID=A0ABT5SRK0_9PSEU|nr:hypothetical protein [Actinomycetospora sp. DW7H6]MDD7965487.1 hypothetical protein [Actinomycetospora sp. DW7H6]
MSGHPIVLRTPWYVGARATPRQDRFSDGQRAPAIQKYDRDDFVDSLLADPRASLRFDRRDRWTFTMPRKPGQGTTLRQRLSTRRTVTTGMRKLYQPAHQRFYAVTIELFCGAPGLPLPAPGPDPRVGFVVRRRVPILGGSLAARRALVRAAARELFGNPDDAADPDETLDEPTLDGALTAAGIDAGFKARHTALLGQVSVEYEIQGWYVDEDTGRGRWAPVPRAVLGPTPEPTDPPPDDLEPGPGTGVPPPGAGETELELPMWRVPTAAQDCERARNRSVWFGAVPTFSGDLDADGAPRFDEHATYVLQCVAHPHHVTPRPAYCPPDAVRSDYSRPYRVAAFFDPAGTAQRPVRITLPDLRALEGQVGSGTARPGVTVETPAGSQLPAPPFGAFPSKPAARPTGGAAELCSFSIELITIVAMFVLRLFLPVVILLFGLWWMLLLRFCWPRPTAVPALLTALGGGFGGLADGPRETLADVLGVDRADRDRVVDLLKAPTALGGLSALQRRELVNELAPDTPPAPPDPPPPLGRPTDPLC